MSFIFNDKNFLNLIYKIAEEPATPAISLEAINTLIDNLKISKPVETISGSSSPAGEFQPSFDQPRVADLAGLPSFLSFLYTTLTKYGDKKIVLEITDPFGTEQNGYKKYQGPTAMLNVNVDGLKAYAELLKTSPDYQSNNLYIEMVGKLIEDINKTFGTNISIGAPGTGATAGAGAAGTLNPEDEICRLKNMVDVNKDQPLKNNEGNNILRVKDLDNFPAWVKANKIDAKDGMVSYSSTDEDPNKGTVCPLLRYLHDRPELVQFKERLFNCAQKCGCQWASGGTSITQPAQQFTGAKTTGETPSLSPQAGAAYNKLKAIISDGGPYQYGKIILGESAQDITTSGLISFINNSAIYLEGLRDSLLKIDSSRAARVAQILKFCSQYIDRLMNMQQTMGDVEFVTANTIARYNNEQDRKYLKEAYHTDLQVILTRIVQPVFNALKEDDKFPKQQTNCDQNVNMLTGIFSR